jgi:tetratricopeptide (TPR) repeat protein
LIKERKKMKKIIILAIVMLFALPIFGQSFEAVGTYYAVKSDISQEHANLTLNILESAIKHFNDVYRLPLDEAPGTFSVRIYSNAEAMEEAVDKIIDVDATSFVLLQYSDPAKNKLFGWYDGNDDAYYTSLLHHGAVHFLKTMVPNAPVFLTKATSIYFEGFSVGSNGTVTATKSLRWLPKAKSYVENISPEKLNAILQADESLVLDEEYYALSWSLVYFFINTDKKDYNRFFWDALSSLDSSKSYAENLASMNREAANYLTPEKFYKDYSDYITQLKTTSELVQSGISLYSQQQMDRASADFLEALVRRPDYYLPYYYLGLIAYSESDYSMADFYYKSALEFGSNEAVTKYALGLSAFSDDRIDEAIEYLNEVLELDPENYTEKVQTVLTRMEVGPVSAEEVSTDTGTESDTENTGDSTE